MSLQTQETSVEAGQPIELFDFRLGTDSFTWTTNPSPVTYNSITYDPLEVKRGALQFSQDNRAESITVTVPSNIGIVRQYINSVPGRQATLTIRRVHRNDPANQVGQLFKGVVQTVSFTLNGHEAEIVIVPITKKLTETIPRFVFSAICNHVLFDQGCTVAASLFRHVGEVTAISGDQLTISGLSARGSGWATAGYVAFGTGDFRQIIAHSGNDIRVLLPFYESPMGQEVEVFAGCDHLAQTCNDKFSNVINHGGFAFTPLKNPFSTGFSKL